MRFSCWTEGTFFHCQPSARFSGFICFFSPSSILDPEAKQNLSPWFSIRTWRRFFWSFCWTSSPPEHRRCQIPSVLKGAGPHTWGGALRLGRGHHTWGGALRLGRGLTPGAGPSYLGGEGSPGPYRLCCPLPYPSCFCRSSHSNNQRRGIEGAPPPSPPPRLFQPFRLYGRANQWRTRVYCLFRAGAAAPPPTHHYRNVPPHQRLYLSLLPG